MRGNMPTLGEFAQIVGAGVLVFNCWQSWRNGQRAKNIGRQVEDIKEQTDGINAKLVKVTGESEYAKGLKQGEDNPRDNGEPVKVEIVKIPPLKEGI